MTLYPLFFVYSSVLYRTEHCKTYTQRNVHASNTQILTAFPGVTYDLYAAFHNDNRTPEV